MGMASGRGLDMSSHQQVVVTTGRRNLGIQAFPAKPHTAAPIWFVSTGFKSRRLLSQGEWGRRGGSDNQCVMCDDVVQCSGAEKKAG